ncbi:LuxR C-terminal-related transcriptional regulator [Actinomyces timonensis]|uniref:LuxR C-terminal-related transcriptional regulator n=1 Tax=Actinomyces timonensis TaxID=1288391 RepID=A0AAU8N1P5_9ACTO
MRRSGARLHVSASTVKTLLSSAQGRLGARNRTQVAVLAARAGLI